jgi:hypothetical protein
MSWSPVPSLGKIARTVGLSTAAGGSAGVLTDFATASKSTVTILALTVIIVFAMITSCLPKILGSLAERRKVIVREKNSAQFMTKEADVRHQIAIAGLDPEKTESAKEMLRSLAVNPVVPKDQQRSDPTYREWLTPSDKPKSVNRKPRPPKDEHVPPKGDPPKSEDGGAVLPFQRPSDE